MPSSPCSPAPTTWVRSPEWSTARAWPVRAASCADLKIEMMRRVVEVNLVGTLTTTKIAVREMAERGGSIVNTATAASMIGKPGRESFNAVATGMIEGITRALADELADYGIRVNAVAPGADGRAEDRATDLPKIADVVAWLLSDAAAETSGSVIRIAQDA